MSSWPRRFKHFASAEKRREDARVVWSLEAVARIEQGAGMVPAAGGGTDGVEAERRVMMDPARLLVWREPRPVQVVYVVRGDLLNGRLVLGALVKGEKVRGRWFVVRVKDARNFVAGMALLARPPGPESTDRTWSFAGNPVRPEMGLRMPRTRGKW